MQRTVYFAGAIALFAVAAVVWSHTALVRTQADPASTVGVPGTAAPAEASVTISPLDMMMKLKTPLPAQQVDDPI